MHKSTFKIFSIALFIVAVVQISGEIIESEILRFIFKPLLMPVLGIGLYKALGNNGSKFSKYILTGIFFAWFGDIFLMFETELFFIAGLVSFLITHVFYSLAYLYLWKNKFNESLLRQKPYLALPYLIFWVVLMYILFPYLEEMLLPVVVYSLIITVMTAFAMNTYGFTKQKSFWLIFLGCILFMLSDTIIAFNKFYMPIAYSSVYIMTTYITAQYLIAKGCLHHYEIPKSPD